MCILIIEKGEYQQLKKCFFFFNILFYIISQKRKERGKNVEVKIIKLMEKKL